MCDIESETSGLDEDHYFELDVYSEDDIPIEPMLGVQVPVEPAITEPAPVEQTLRHSLR